MKYFLILITFFSCSTLKKERGIDPSTKEEECEILEVFLTSTEVSNIININKDIQDARSIRVVSSKAFFDCSFFVNGKFEVFTQRDMSPDLNTGTYRDIVITSVVFSTNKATIDSYCAFYKGCTQTNYHIKTDVVSDKNGSFVIENVHFAEWHASRALGDYE